MKTKAQYYSTLPLYFCLLCLGSFCEANTIPSSANSPISIVDNAADFIVHNSMVLDSNGFPVISYKASQNLMLARCLDTACENVTRTIIDENIATIYDTSIALTNTDIPIIAYNSSASGLKMAICNDTACSNPLIKTLFNFQNGDIRDDVSLALNSSGFPVVSFRSNAYDLLIVVCNDVNCEEGIVSSLATGIQTGVHNSLALVDDIPIVSFSEKVDGSFLHILKIAICGDSVCSQSNKTIAILDDFPTDVGKYNAITINNGQITVSYQDVIQKQLRLVVCRDMLCNTLNRTILTEGVAVQHIDMIMGSTGLPIISYQRTYTDQLRIIVCRDYLCYRRIETIFDNKLLIRNPSQPSTVLGDIEIFSSLALNDAGIPVLTFSGPYTLKLTVCSMCVIPVHRNLDSEVTTYTGQVQPDTFFREFS